MANGNPVVLGSSDTSTKETRIQATTASTQAGLSVQNFGGGSVVAGSVAGTGLTAGSLMGTGISAESFAGSGVVAKCVDTRDIPGISTGVLGEVQGGFGVVGNNVRGRFPQSGATGRALSAIGVDGISRFGFGVRGLTFSNSISNSAGLLGVGSPGHGVVGIATQTRTTPPTSAPPPFVPQGPLFAGLFVGNVQVSGDFMVTGRKSAVVKHPDGTHRRLHCVEAPEAWFEDLGTAELAKGRATVAFDETFAALVRRDDYHVFLTPEGDCRGLYVARKTRTGFEVRELQGGTASLAFSWRVIARRADVKGERLEAVELGVPPDTASLVEALPKPSRRTAEARLEEALRTLEKEGDGRRR